MDLTTETGKLDKLARSYLNSSQHRIRDHGSITGLRPLLSTDLFNTVLYVLSWALTSTGTLGVISNILVLTTYIKLGFSESINISYFALGISDLGVSFTTIWGGISNLLVVTEARIPFNALEISSPTVFWPAEGLEKTTTCITAYIALEKCLCVLLPLHVKSFMNPRKTLFVVLTISFLIFGPSNFSFIVYKFQWSFDSVKNASILRTLEETSPLHKAFQSFMLLYFSTIIHYTALCVIWVCTIFLAVSLQETMKGRATKFGQDKSSALNIRNRRVIKTVFLIASAYLVFSTPRAVCNVIRIFEQEFHVRGIYFRTYMLIIVACVQLSLFNSSTNVLIYIYMNTKFRNTLRNMICRSKSL
ncbi:hypothetical protein RRG08_056249 [Elysia crispata]|uniref:G-protein coupled receptors family 1 profile domain-containing protein n=1 Tax=Elysia crispata TaxID=231223 RepID=A0AAE1AXM5_9GAST|nr:hypothetical protein RRG08_056249 [Elysia crispata]